MDDARPFLTAEWRYLAMLNYDVDPTVLRPLIPAGVELDTFEGRACISLVGFMFLRTRVLGIPIPFCRNFEEVNLRFYVRRKATDGWRRGVVFVKELVPRRIIAWVARTAYNENYLALKMDHRIDRRSQEPDSPSSVTYSWQFNENNYQIHVATMGADYVAPPGSEEEFITEHYWGYCRQRDGGTVEYRVAHPSWLVWPGSAS